MQDQNQRIKPWMGWCLIGVAATIDLIEFILDIFLIGEILSPIISVGADALFWIWFKMLGVDFAKNPKNLAAMATQAFIGLIPGADILPELTVAVFLIVKITQAIDRGKATTQQSLVHPPNNIITPRKR